MKDLVRVEHSESKVLVCVSGRADAVESTLCQVFAGASLFLAGVSLLALVAAASLAGKLVGLTALALSGLFLVTLTARILWCSVGIEEWDMSRAGVVMERRFDSWVSARRSVSWEEVAWIGVCGKRVKRRAASAVTLYGFQVVAARTQFSGWGDFSADDASAINVLLAERLSVWGCPGAVYPVAAASPPG